MEATRRNNLVAGSIFKPRANVHFQEFDDIALHLPDALCVIDSAGRVLQANNAAAKFLDCKVEDLKENSLYHLFSDSPKKLHQMIRNWSRSRVMVPGALNIRGSNSHSAACHCAGSLLHPKTDKDSALILLRLERRENFTKSFSALNTKIEQLTKEIAERRITQKALAKSRAEFVSIFNAITDGVAFADLDRKFVMVNPAFINLFGYSEKELIGTTTEKLYVSREQFLDQGHRRYRSGPGIEEGVYEIQYKRKDGSVFWAETLGTKVVDEQGATLGFTALIRDISERKRTEEELHRYREDLEKLVEQRTHKLISINRELEAFSYSVSHDLRSPLRGIDGFSLALLEDYGDKLDEDGRHYLDRIRHNAQHMSQLIDDLLELSRIPRMEFRMETINLSEIAETVIQRLIESEPERKVKVNIMPGIMVSSDKTLLTVAIENLIGNAWKYTGGEDEAQISVGRKIINESPVYFVADNGVGFDMQYADKLFGVFQRMHVSSEFEGTGIGLASVNRIIDRHGGRIWAESAIGKGTTLYFTLSPSNANATKDTRFSPDENIEHKY